MVIRAAFVWGLSLMLLWVASANSAPRSKECTLIDAQMRRLYDDHRHDKDWGLMNHYCNCVLEYYRLLRAKTDEDRRYRFNNAITNCQYSLAHTSPDFPARVAVHLYMGKIYKAYRDYPKAIEEYRIALKSDPALVYAYTGISDIYKYQHNYQRALEVIEAGLRHVPKSKVLRKRKKRLETRLARMSGSD